jgi:hypothetical protein
MMGGLNHWAQLLHKLESKMRVVIDELAQRDVNAADLAELRAALEQATFADACCIGALAGATIIIRCPNAPHGVIVDTSQLAPSYVRWIVNALEGSVSAGGA